MLRFLSTLTQFMISVLVLALVALVGVGGWFGYRAYDARQRAAEAIQQKLADQEAQIARLENDLAARLAQIESLETANRLLKVDHRIAQLDVLSQQGTAEAGDLVTRVAFVEVDEHGKPLDRARVFNVAGDVVYIDAWVVKFSDEYVEQGDALRSTSICLFRRLFGESQQPKDGFELDPVGARPAAYGLGKEVSPMEKDLWSRFWQYANDPATARKAGVRAAHGEAPSIKLMPGRRYKILLRASGGLTIAAEEAPAGPAL